MCLLFLFTNPNPCIDDYCLVLASIRDEFFDRPSRQCHFWEHNPHIVGGIDFSEGKEYGTWLAMNTQGKIAALLNVIKPIDVFESKKCRGFLSVDYLLNDLNGLTYLNKIAKTSTDFDGFLLVAIDIKPENKVKATYLTNMDQTNKPHSLESGVHVFGNCLPGQPWKKVCFAKRNFTKIVLNNSKIQSKENLVNSLFEMMNDSKEHFPDNQLVSDANGLPLNEADIRKLSSVWVRIPNILFGSRTQSIILIDALGNVDYVERTMHEPIHTSQPRQSRQPSEPAQAAQPIHDRNLSNWIDTRLAFRLRHNNSLSVSRL